MATSSSSSSSSSNASGGEQPTMPYRFLGRSGLKVSALSFGSWMTMGMQIDEETATECMKAAFDAGINFFDNAEVYASGDSELVMGRVIKRLGWQRSDLVISTKIFWGGGHKRPRGPNDVGLSRKHIIEGLQASLARLQLEYVDLVFCHRPDPKTPIEETVRAMNWVIEKGWAFYWGTSEWSAQQITEAHAVAHRLNLIPPLMEQPQYSLLHRERFEAEYEPLYRNFGLGTTTWSPLASGLLAGKYNDGSIPSDSRFGKADESIDLSWRNALLKDTDGALLGKLRALKEVADDLECSMAQLSIAWCLLNPNVSTVILGASRASQVIENVAALKVVPKLTPGVIERLESIVANKPKAPFHWGRV